MTTFREAAAAKRERLRREARYYTPDRLSRHACRYCKQRLPVALVHAGVWVHPTCGPRR